MPSGFDWEKYYASLPKDEYFGNIWRMYPERLQSSFDWIECREDCEVNDIELILDDFLSVCDQKVLDNIVHFLKRKYKYRGSFWDWYRNLTPPFRYEEIGLMLLDESERKYDKWRFASFVEEWCMDKCEKERLTLR